MPASLQHRAVAGALAAARRPATVEVALPGEDRPRAVPRPFPSPADWRDHWIYFLMIDRFDGPEPPRTEWDRSADGRQGGTLEGVRRRLGYLRELGAGAVWLTPVLKNRQAPADGSHHGYGIMDFLEVDPRLGSAPERAEAELVALVDEAHARGMYVILDVVINHAGDLFGYEVGEETWDAAPWRGDPYPVRWRDETGRVRADWPELPRDGSLPREAGVWPEELQRNEWFRRQGKGGDLEGDFETLKEFRTELADGFGDRPVWNLLVRAYQYVIARFDVDGFRIDTLKHVEREFALTFCNAMREFALSAGKQNFFLFGENKSDDEALLAAYTGRFTSEEEGRVGADAALDFPLQWKLAPAVKGFGSVREVQDMFERRKRVHREKHLLSTHGEASRFFVTFLDNHDDHHRFLYPRDGGDLSAQVTLALGCLFCLQGIPCLYYGTEQGLRGTRELYEDGPGGKPEHVREALWGKPDAFDTGHPLFREVRAIAALRAREPALRFGRQYFRQLSGNGEDFGYSAGTGGVIAFSRILDDREVLVVANTSGSAEFAGWAVVDPRLHGDGSRFSVAYSNRGTAGSGAPAGGPARFHEAGSVSEGWARRLFVRLAPMEIQVLAPEV